MENRVGISREEFTFLEQRVNNLEQRQTRTETRVDNIEKKLDKIDSNTTWILRLIGGGLLGLVGTAIIFVIKNGGI